MGFMQRVMLTQLVPAGLVAVLGGFVLVGTSSMESRLGEYFSKQDALAGHVVEMYAQGLQMGQALRNVALDPSNKKAYDNLENAGRDYDKAALAAAAAADPAEKKQLDAMAGMRARLAQVQAEVARLAAQDPAAAIEMLNKQETPAWRELRGVLLELKKVSVAEKERARVEASAAMTKARGWVLVIVVACLIVCAVLLQQLRAVLRRELGGDPAVARAVLQRVAEGDLVAEAPVAPGDQHSMMSALARTQQSLRALVADVGQSAQAISGATGEIAAGNQDLSNRTERQAGSLQETAASMEQLASTVRLNADTAAEANQLARQASSLATDGGTVVQQVVQTMDAISGQGRKIADITSVIDGIAFQTNILALNAAVEAARAGEQGRGFAVVAGEVRSLAQRSAEAAREIKQLIAENIEKISGGSQQVEQAGQTMAELVRQVQRVSSLIGEISTATREQSGGLGQVSEAMGRLDEVTQQNAALVEESTAAAMSLNEQASRLEGLVGVFRVR